MSAADHEAVREFIGSGGEHSAEPTAGISLATGSQVVGLRIKTRGRVKPLTRWHKEFTLYAKDDQTLDDLERALLAIPTPSDGEGTD